MTEEEIFHAQMRHTRMKKEFTLRRHEGEKSLPRDKHGIHIVRLAQFLNRIIAAQGMPSSFAVRAASARFASVYRVPRRTVVTIALPAAIRD